MSGTQLERALAEATTVAEAAEVVTAYLEAAGLSMPSVYIAIGGRLRCFAQRGYWQVHDGVDAGVGIVGATFRAGEPSIIPDVTRSPDFVAAGPGIIAEVAFPLRHDGAVVGVLNAEVCRPLEEGDVTVARRGAGALERRIGELGGVPRETPWQRLARESAALARLHQASDVVNRAVQVSCGLAGMDSALLVTTRLGRPHVAAACGPLGPVLAALRPDTLEAIASWTGGGSSVYTFGDFPGVGFVGSQHVWDAGVAALVSVPLAGVGRPGGFLLVADRAPKQPGTDEVQVLELFAVHVATALHAVEAFDELRVQASRDGLTGLGHHGAFHEHLERARRRVGIRGLAVLLIDADAFKRINDTVGHVAGDRAIMEIASALAESLRGSDTVFRIGGDEFAAVVEVATSDEAIAVGERLRAAVAGTGHTTVSVGVAFADREALPRISVDLLRGDADLALYEAKRNGRDRTELFRAPLRAAVIDRARLAAQLAGAEERGELFLVFQPVVDLPSGMILGAEALLRWQHPDRGVVPPAEFITVAEEDGQIRALGNWVLDQACREAVTWNAGRPPQQWIKVAVNVSGQQLTPDYVEFVARTLDDTGLPADALVMEITESALVEQADRVEVLRAIRGLGAHVAVDDFGTGYSSLSYLRRLPIDIVKIDRSFVAELDEPRNAAVARAIVDLTRTLRLSSVAEGVETHQQVRQLLELGCEHAQGFLFSPPVRRDELRVLLRDGLGWSPPGVVRRSGT